ncbi:vWA domain-containing protein [Cupriavidus taiwanensis]|uniref:vWA domain-containing protein n=1 Tax=Cupriavidus taiwanensis TaxID=164546 RepID=UPI000E10A9E0|nr:VWA domain-containing protein [Cupriavidus taiwanensis]SOY55190.1 carbon monoxide dehydrogenase accessory protein; may be involved in the addition of the Cu-ion to CoxL [Cupriavidus taiwanensis]SOY89211.1 carbon monoxide dehydrogenase accessory protein; may be involved in the addition of the Cu-ion to CoxL [Cupriavidus taiwanensis]SOZ61449.1 carbon monoxide dehydrogenase accessory protein; may be involved in the addition of the Cu-ion to CoxL [Cupriavidus taiwanensis]SOZ81516.1 carbon monoxi
MLHAGARSRGPQGGLPVLARNVTHFMRLLRDGGFALSPAHAVDALAALRLVDIGQRDEVRAALAALVLSGPDQRPLFDAAFDLFWRDPDWEGKLRALLLPRVDAGAPPPRRSNRLADALAARQPEMPSRPAQTEAERIHVPLTFSDQERLAQRDFETLSAQEWRALQHLVRTRRTHLALQRTRRLRAATCGSHADLRASARLAVRQHGEWLRWKLRKHAERKPPLVLLLDISGSMSQYSRAVLYFCHALMQSRERLAVFLFGTRLTNITRSLRERDPDEAVAVITGQVRDWAGGTRIGAALASFNRHWARRTLSGRATVLLVTDGLDHEQIELLGEEMARLRRFAHRIVWLNPLLRYPGFTPQARGVQAILPHVDALRPAHNLDSLLALETLLSEHGGPARAATTAIPAPPHKEAPPWK